MYKLTFPIPKFSFFISKKFRPPIINKILDPHQVVSEPAMGPWTLGFFQFESHNLKMFAKFIKQKLYKIKYRAKNLRPPAIFCGRPPMGEIFGPHIRIFKTDPPIKKPCPAMIDNDILKFPGIKYSSAKVVTFILTKFSKDINYCHYNFV